MKCFEKAAM